ncbi:MAG: MBL fold metallo-hydrolase [Omnitrophica WOR_2 bacterium SM23_29]|nr:MAG: MBL fold metallo-hydrolase [Omnitrophica WOR_2 bacterium SM23_29]
MDYILETISVGPMESNCYIFGCRRTREAVIIDPGSDYAEIKKRLERVEISAKYILNTHGHADHIGANGKFGLPILIHRHDALFLRNPIKNLSAMFGLTVSSPKANKFLEDGDKINIGKLVLEIFHTPGHTPGSISIKYDDLVFTGDTLFCEGVGRTDFPYSSEKDLFKSIREKLLVLPDSTKIYPGHGPASTIGHERKNNPFL